jgi:hypothetical protein
MYLLLDYRLRPQGVGVVVLKAGNPQRSKLRAELTLIG